MPGKNIAIEMAGFCALVTADRPEIPAHVQKRFAGYSSERKPYFTVTFKSGNDSAPAQATDFNTMRLIRCRGGYRVCFGATGKEPRYFTAGFIDTRSRTCVFSNFMRPVTSAYIDSAILTCFQLFLLLHDGFVLHASAVVRNGQALVFTGKSGSGKTTIAGGPHGGRLLADDLICIRKQRRRFVVHGTPWHSRRRPRPATAGNFFFLAHSKSTRISACPPGRSAGRLLANISSNVLDPALHARLLNTIASIATHHHCHNLSFSLADPYWKLLTQYLENYT